MSENDEWREPMTPRVLDYLNALPDAANPVSDDYMTAFVNVLLRQSGVPASDERIQKGIAWLKREQRVSGRWWMQSLFKGTHHFTTYLATAQALKALALCGEIPELR